MPETKFPGKWDGSVFARYLPQWLAIQSPTIRNVTYGAEAYGSFKYGLQLAESTLLYKWFGSSLPQFNTLHRYISSFRGHNTISDTALDTPRLAWITKTTQEPLTVTVSGNAVRRAASIFDFLTTADRVYKYDNNLCYFRNLAVTSTTVSSNTASYTIPEDIEEDGMAWISSDSVWYQVSPGQELDTTNATANLPLTGSIEFRYTSSTYVETLSSSAILTIDGSTIIPTQIDLWNVFDEKALLAGIERLPKESNKTLQGRIRTAYLSPANSQLNGLISAIGREVGLIGSLQWDGSSTIDFEASGISNVKQIVIKDLEEFGFVEGEQLTPSDDYTTYHSQHAHWEGNWYIYVDGLRATSSTPPYPTIEDEHIEFGQATSGRVAATYRYRNYTLETTGTSASLYPTSNTQIGEYTVVYVTGIDINTPTDIKYKNSNLLSSTGNPTAEFIELVNTIHSTVPITAGTANWGKTTPWFTDTEPQPELTNLPILFD